MMHLGVITNEHVTFENNKVVSILGVTIDPKQGVIVDRSKFAVNNLDDEVTNVAPVTIQKYRCVDLQKISNSIAKQGSKNSKLIQDLTEEDNSEEL